DGRAPEDPPAPTVPCTALPLQAGWVMALAFSPDGGLVAVGISKGSDQGEYQLWDTATWQSRASPSKPAGAISALGFSPDGQVLATGTRQGAVRVWNVASGAPQGVMRTSDRNWTSQVVF